MNHNAIIRHVATADAGDGGDDYDNAMVTMPTTMMAVGIVPTRMTTMTMMLTMGMTVMLMMAPHGGHTHTQLWAEQNAGMHDKPKQQGLENLKVQVR